MKFTEILECVDIQGDLSLPTDARLVRRMGLQNISQTSTREQLATCIVIGRSNRFWAYLKFKSMHTRLVECHSIVQVPFEKLALPTRDASWKTHISLADEDMLVIGYTDTVVRTTCVLYVWKRLSKCNENALVLSKLCSVDQARMLFTLISPGDR